MTLIETKMIGYIRELTYRDPHGIIFIIWEYPDKTTEFMGAFL